jgi:hypothetical protein
MADQETVRRIALALPETVEATDRFAFSVLNKGKAKGFVWVWYERVEPKKPRVPGQTWNVGVRMARASVWNASWNDTYAADESGTTSSASTSTACTTK